MTLRLSLPAIACGFLAFVGTAAAQYQPQGPYREVPGAYRAAPAAEEEDGGPYVPADPPATNSVPGPNGHDFSSRPYYGNQPPEARSDRAPPPAPSRGFSGIPIFGPLLSPLDNSGPANNQPPPAQYGARPGDGMQQGGTQPDRTQQGSLPQPLRPPADIGPIPGTTLASLPPEDQPEIEKKEVPEQFRRQFVDYPTKEPVGTIIIDTPNTYLYLVLANGKAMRYGIGVGREGFTWAGTERISRMAEWPDWHPPAEMIERQPYLPRFMAGGEGNPLGARALYLGKSLYRIHGTNQPSTIGTFVSSGCIRLINEDVADLYSRVTVGTRVVVLPGRAPSPAAQNLPAPQTIR